jgi:hypothetical protein
VGVNYKEIDYKFIIPKLNENFKLNPARINENDIIKGMEKLRNPKPVNTNLRGEWSIEEKLTLQALTKENPGLSSKEHARLMAGKFPNGRAYTIDSIFKQIDVLKKTPLPAEFNNNDNNTDDTK